MHADLFPLQMQDCPLDSSVDVACRDLITGHALLDTCSPLTADSIILAFYGDQRFRIGFLSSRSSNTNLFHRPPSPVIIETRWLPTKYYKCSRAFKERFHRIMACQTTCVKRCTVKIAGSSAGPLSCMESVQKSVS